jgi:DNA invertase Pin-like site-specific DNA recombinase
MKIKAFAYLRTSSATNVGEDKDSDKRQRAAVTAFAKARGFEIVAEYYDAAVSGTMPVNKRPGFQAMMEHIAGDGVRHILVESPDRFARDLIVQLTGHDFLKGMGVTLMPTTAPDFFTEDTPTAKLVRNVLGAISEFEKASIAAKLKSGRDRKRERTGERVGGTANYAETKPEMVTLAQKLARKPRMGRKRSLRGIAVALADAGHLSATGTPYTAASVARMLQQRTRKATERRAGEAAA